MSDGLSRRAACGDVDEPDGPVSRYLETTERHRDRHRGSSQFAPDGSVPTVFPMRSCRQSGEAALVISTKSSVTGRLLGPVIQIGRGLWRFDGSDELGGPSELLLLV